MVGNFISIRKTNVHSLYIIRVRETGKDTYDLTTKAQFQVAAVNTFQ